MDQKEFDERMRDPGEQAAVEAAMEKLKTIITTHPALAVPEAGNRTFLGFREWSHLF